MKKLICITSSLPVRVLPEHSSEQETCMLFGDTAQFIEKVNEIWIKVQVDWGKDEGYILSSQVIELPSEVIKESSLHLVSSTRTYILTHGNAFLLPLASSLHGMADEKIRYGNLKYYINGEYRNIQEKLFSIDELKELLLSFLEVPYYWSGLTHAGIDCSGLTKLWYKLQHIPLPHSAKKQQLLGKQILLLNEVQFGDLAFFSDEDGSIHHVGILLSPSEIIHATETAGKVVIQTIFPKGIWSNEKNDFTHQLHSIKRLIE